MNYPTNTAMLIDIMNKYGKYSKEYDTFKKHSLIYGHKTKILYKIYQSILKKPLTNIQKCDIINTSKERKR